MRVDWRTITFKPITAHDVASRLYNAARNKAAGRKLDFDLKFNTVFRQVDRGYCMVTGIPFDMRDSPVHGIDLPFRPSLDRIDNTRGYFDNNVQVVVKMYNTAKYYWNDEDVLIMAKGLVSSQQYR